MTEAIAFIIGGGLGLFLGWFIWAETEAHRIRRDEIGKL